MIVADFMSQGRDEEFFILGNFGGRHLWTTELFMQWYIKVSQGISLSDETKHKLLGHKDAA